ncbi:MAG TPA: DNA-binding protein [Romboutsia timonensis]|uniref:DNA-binding protein n=1 Tax=Romboutsia timonensis TaxID=1776391 RepID=A0A921T016_9FIRM|nr:DNA-binding protein [Romboutsia timonensis]
MKDKERIKKFIELQDKNLKFEDIALELGIAKTTLRVFLNKNGYKMNNGKYKLKDDFIEFKQIEFEENKNYNKNKSTKTKENKTTSKKEKDITKTGKTKESNLKKNIKVENKVENKTTKRQIPKKDRKINITQEDLDKLCEVYDWYMEVKDLKSMKSNSSKNKKDIKIEDTNLESLKSTNIKVDKKTWEDFERLCSNSKFSKQEIITQALKDFMKEYKNLL